MKIFRDKTVLLISPEPWEHDFVSKHHYAITLALNNNRVFFLNPTSSKNLCKPSGVPNIWIIDYRPTIRGLNYFPWFLAVAFMKIEARRIRKLAKRNFDIVWSFDPFRFQALNIFKATYNIYYAADVHAIRLREDLISNSADIVLAPAQAILNEIDTSTPKVKIGHGVADYFFNNSAKAILPGLHPVKIVYVGNLGSKYLANELLEELVQVNEKHDFIFIGNGHKLSETLRRKSNVYTLGSIKNEALPGILHGADVTMLCYDTDKFSKEASNSHKILEYLSIGKVVVSTRMDEYLEKDLIVMPEENKQLPDLMKTVIERLTYYNQIAFSEKRRAYAFQYTYSKLLGKIDELLSEIITKA